MEFLNCFLKWYQSVLIYPAVPVAGKHSYPGIMSHHHRVDLPLDLLVPGQGSLQALLRVQLRVSTLVDVSTNTGNKYNNSSYITNNNNMRKATDLI